MTNDQSTVTVDDVLREVVRSNGVQADGLAGVTLAAYVEAAALPRSGRSINLRQSVPAYFGAVRR
jgi:hypothetical protein